MSTHSSYVMAYLQGICCQFEQYVYLNQCVYASSTEIGGLKQ